MFGRGSLNGDQVNGFAANDGAFVEEVDASSPVTALGAGRAARRFVIAAIDGLVSSGALHVSVRHRIAALNGALASGGATVMRRLVATAAAPAELACETTLIRRVVASADEPVSLKDRLVLSWSFLHRADIRRALRLRELRHLNVHADLRRMLVPRRVTSIIAPPERLSRP